ncbi:MAG: dienelactone hydrolase family protein [Planctomycetota bacterium]
MSCFLLRVIGICAMLATLSEAADRPARPIPDGDGPRARFLKLIDRPRVPLQATEQPPVVQANLREIEFAFDAEAGQRVPGLLIAPVSVTGRLPVVIALHGTGGDKERLRPLLRQLAARGVIGVAIDGRFAGERTGQVPDAYRAAIFETWKSGEGFPFLYDTVWDVLRLLDYLETRPDVDPLKIGAIGFSKGGTEVYFAAAADERLTAAVPCIGVQSFGWALQHNAWQSRIGTIQSAVDGAASDVGERRVDAAFVRRFYERVVPGIHQEFDAPVMLPLIAPRALLVINGDRDDRTPLPGLKLCTAAAHEAYQQAGAAKQFEFRLQPNTRHMVNPDSEQYAVEWLVRHLGK